MNFLTANFENEICTLQSFDQIANKLANDVLFVVNKSKYRIVDFEFYSFGEQFQDPHTYKNALQLESGKIYLHGSGIDITFGDGTNYGGILIKSVIKLYDGADTEEGYMKKQYDGPHKVATELFAGLHSLVNKEGKNTIELEDIKGYHADSFFHRPVAVLKTKRFGLTPKKEDPDDKFLQMPLRYIVMVPKFPNFKQTLKGIETIVGEHIKNGKLTSSEAEDILGYKRSF